jgi:hypothetical protein
MLINVVMVRFYLIYNCNDDDGDDDDDDDDGNADAAAADDDDDDDSVDYDINGDDVCLKCNILRLFQHTPIFISFQSDQQ